MFLDDAIQELKEGNDITLPKWNDKYYSWEDGNIIFFDGKNYKKVSERDAFYGNGSKLRRDWKLYSKKPSEDADPEWWKSFNFAPQQPHYFKRGDKKEEIKTIQEALNEKGAGLGKPDGVYGEKTESAVKRFQKTVGLVQDGVFGEKTAKALAGYIFPELLTHDDMLSAAEKLSCRVEAVMAVSMVESSGLGFLMSKRPKILFERHYMYRLLKQNGVDADKLVPQNANIINPHTGGYKGGEAEYSRLDRAKSFNITCAYESASWGAYQIMGVHWKDLGYESAKSFVDLMYENEGNQLDAFVRFIKNDHRLLSAIQKEEIDAPRFASIFNGPNYKNHPVPYDVQIKNEFDRLVSMK